MLSVIIKTILFLLLLPSLLFAQAWQEARMNPYVSGAVTAGETSFACLNNGDLLEETFNPSGYDDGDWTEGGTGGTVDEDLSVPAVSGFNNQCLRTYISGAWKGAKAINTFSAQTQVYFRTYIYVNSENLADTEDRIIIRFTGLNEKVTLYKSGSQLQFRLYTDETLRDTVNISVQTSYLLEIYLDNSAPDSWEWKLDGVSQGSGANTVFENISAVAVGIIDETAENHTIDIYWDNIGINSSDWLGSCS